MEVLFFYSMSFTQKSFMCQRRDMKFSNECVGTVTWKIYFVITLWKFPWSFINKLFNGSSTSSTWDRFCAKFRSFSKELNFGSPKMCFFPTDWGIVFYVPSHVLRDKRINISLFHFSHITFVKCKFTGSRFIAGDKNLLWLQFLIS